MPKGRVLTASEREEIARMHAAGASAREIGKQLERSKTVVLNFLKAPTEYAQIKRSGRKRALSGDDERRLYAAISQRMAQPGADSAHPDVKRSAEQIRREFNVPLSTRRIQQLLSEWRREARRAQDQQQEEQQPQEATAAKDEAAEVVTAALSSPPGGEQQVSVISTSAPAAAQQAQSEPSTSADTSERPEDLVETRPQEPSAVPTETTSSDSLASPSPENAAIEV